MTIAMGKIFRPFRTVSAVYIKDLKRAFKGHHA